MSQVKATGLLVGNGNHCDYFVGQLRHYTGTQQQMKSYYSNVKIWNTLNKTWQPLKLVFLKDGKIPKYAQYHLPAGDKSASQWSPLVNTGNKKFYIIYFLAAGYEAGLDLRCV